MESLFQLQIPDVDFVVCDVETTGLSPELHRMTEIALFRVREGDVVDRFSSLINPRQFITREITTLTGITNEMVYGAPEIEDVLPTVQRFCTGAIFTAHNVRFDRQFVDRSLVRAKMEPLQTPMLCTARLARRLLPELKQKNLGSIARHLHITNRARHRAEGDAEATVRVLGHFLQVLEEEFDITEVADLLSFQHRPVFRVVSPPANVQRIKDQVAALPQHPGVYYFRDRHARVIYVGKARSLRDRVQSYFRHNIGHTEKVKSLVKSIHSLDFTETETELSALLLEAREVRRLQPHFNSQLKNFRKYPFLKLWDRDGYPSLTWCYDIEEDGGEYFGPFRSRSAVENAVDLINRLFQLRECDLRLDPHRPLAPCLYHGIERCGAPCAGLQSREEYAAEVEAVRLFLRGDHADVVSRLRARMQAKSDALDFEGAAILRDRIRRLEMILRQQETMVRAVTEQQLVIVTPARRTLVELHWIRQGRLLRQEVMNQRAPDHVRIARQVRECFFGEQEALTFVGEEDVNEMRIISSWCLTRRQESEIVDVAPSHPPEAVTEDVLRAIQQAGQKKDA